MKLLEAYSNSCGVKIPSKPVLPYATFFPLPFSKYITFHPSSGMQSKNYDYYAEVLSLIFQDLQLKGFKIVQIGSKDDPFFQGCFDLRGQTDLYQATHVVKNAALHLGNDSVWAHVAGAYSVPVVVPFGATYSNVCAPYYYDKGIFIESHRKGKKASCAAYEEIKTINFIMPEEIGQAVLDLLKIDKKINRKTLFIGKDYTNFKINIIPSAPVIHTEFLNCIFDVRADIFYDPSVIAPIINSVKCNIHISQPETFDLGLLGNKKNVNSVILHVESSGRAKASIPFLKFIKSNFNHLVEFEGDSNEVGMARMHLFDFNFNAKEKVDSPIKEKHTLFKSTNLFYSDEKIYLTKWHYDMGLSQPSIDNNIGQVEDSSEFWAGLDNFLIFKNELD